MQDTNAQTSPFTERGKQPVNRCGDFLTFVAVEADFVPKSAF
jgi:hypothetical protein